ncbi:MAG: hypothetical protein ACFFFG_11115 [Candidatus Thorarchaeota archaeon]
MAADSKPVFDIVVIDTNFFISLLNAGVINSLLPKLQEIARSVGMEIMVPAEIPKSDIPGKFRELRTSIPKYVRLEPVNRKSNLWTQIAAYSQKEHMVRADKDPADIDVVILAKKFTLIDNNKVACVSDDEGVARIIKENAIFRGIDHLSCGSFVSVLSASVKDPKMRQILDKTVERVFHASWSYKKRTRRYIDVAMLIKDLGDTARFVRTAAQFSSGDKGEKGDIISAESSPIKNQLEILTPEDALLVAQQLVIKARDARESFNIQEAENIITEILATSSQLIYQIGSLEQRVIVERMLRSELFEHHSWLLDYKLTRNQVTEALVHAEACRVFMNFISVGKEAIENVISLQGLLYLLLGEYEQALSLFKSIPAMDPELSSTQLLGLAVSLVAIGQENNAAVLVKRYPDLIEGVLSSVHTYAVDLYTHGQRELAIQILKFVVKNFEKTEEGPRSLYRLFVFSRLRPDLVELDLKVLDLFKKELKNRAKDNSKRGIPTLLLKEIPIEINSHDEEEGPARQFKGFYHVLDLIDSPERDEIHLIAWNEGNNSTWNLVFDSGFKPVLEDSVKLMITSGTIVKIRPRRKRDPYRGTLVFENPVIQPELVKPW